MKNNGVQNDLLSDLFGLEGRVAIVAGASRGIGASIANGLVGAGAHTVGVGRSKVSSAELDEKVQYVSCDVTDNIAFGKICNDLSEQKGKIDILVFAAGITYPTNLAWQSITDFNQTIEINLTSAFSCIKEVVPFMEKADGGSIVNVTSICAEFGFPNNPAYVAAKGGLKMLTKAMAYDLAPKNIRVNNLSPGYILTDMTRESHDDPARHDERLKHMLIKRWGKPNDLVGAAIYLASPASAYATGIDLVVDGGWSAKGL